MRVSGFPVWGAKVQSLRLKLQFHVYGQRFPVNCLSSAIRVKSPALKGAWVYSVCSQGLEFRVCGRVYSSRNRTSQSLRFKTLGHNSNENIPFHSG